MKDKIIRNRLCLSSHLSYLSRFDTELLLAHTLKCQTIDLYKNQHRVLTPSQYSRFQKLLRKYKKGYPVAYLIGQKEFMSLNFKVTPAVLIPRPETELLAETVIACINILMRNNRCLQNNPITIFDLGTGSGNIAISIAKHFSTKHLRIMASDISGPALRVARFNARYNQVSQHIKFCCGNLFKPFKDIKADIIVSNPPYVDKNDKPKWQAGLRYEPAQALWAKEKGFFYINKIINLAPSYLKPDGYLLMEIGYDQANTVLNTIKTSKKFRNVKILNDYNNIPRVLHAISNH